MCDGGEVSGKSHAIDVVLHESLRAEIQARMGARFQLIGFLSITATVLAAKNLSTQSRVLLIMFTLIVFIAVWFSFGFYIRRCARRLPSVNLASLHLVLVARLASTAAGHLCLASLDA
jgi:hypothetical protein